jgi:hypothetical protein
VAITMIGARLGPTSTAGGGSLPAGDGRGGLQHRPGEVDLGPTRLPGSGAGTPTHLWQGTPVAALGLEPPLPRSLRVWD